MEVVSDSEKQYLCYLCNKILINPFQSSCGNRYCYNCSVEKNIYDDHLCDICGLNLENNHEFFKDKSIEKELSKRIILCTNKKCGIKLNYLDLPQHVLNCQYTEQKCKFCDEIVELYVMDKHISQLCANAIITCKFCLNKYRKKFIDDIHLNSNGELSKVCEKWRAENCSLCSKSLKDKNVTMHLKECTERTLFCIMAGYGCTFCGNFKQLEEHYKTEAFGHLKIMLNELEKVKLEDESIKKNFEETKLNNLKEKNMLSALNNELTEQVNGINKECNRLFDTVKETNEELKAVKLKLLNDDVTSVINRDIYALDGFLFVIPDIKQKIYNAKSGGEQTVISDQFYTGCPGYKMYIKLYLNGDGVGHGQYLSLFFVLVSGDYDGDVNWPFKQRIKFQLLASTTNQSNFSVSLKPDNNLECYGKPNPQSANIGTGQPKFINISNIINSDHYIYKNSLRLKMSF